MKIEANTRKTYTALDGMKTSGSSYSSGFVGSSYGGGLVL
jgi:hypothetical protein